MMVEEILDIVPHGLNFSHCFTSTWQVLESHLHSWHITHCSLRRRLQWSLFMLFLYPRIHLEINSYISQRSLLSLFYSALVSFTLLVYFNITDFACLYCHHCYRQHFCNGVAAFMGVACLAARVKTVIGYITYTSP